MTQAECAAYARFADAMRKVEWDIHYLHCRGLGLPGAWHEIALSPGLQPKKRITIGIDRKW